MAESNSSAPGLGSLRTVAVLYGAAPWPGEEPWLPRPSPFTPAPDTGTKPFFVPSSPSADEIARKVAEALKAKPGKVDPPPAEANRELDAIKAIVTALASLDALVASLDEQLTPEEKARVLRYVEDRYGKVASRE